MLRKIVIIDFYNDSFYIADGDFDHLWTVKDNFLNTGFPYKDNVGMINYEPMRNFFSVEYLGGQTLHHRTEEIEWIENNFDLLLQSARDEKDLSQNPSLTIRQLREIKLYDTDWMVVRHQEELICGEPTTLSELQFEALASYRRWLRDIPLTYPDVDMDLNSNNILWAELNIEIVPETPAEE